MAPFGLRALSVMLSLSILYLSLPSYSSEVPQRIPPQFPLVIDVTPSIQSKYYQVTGKTGSSISLHCKDRRKIAACFVWKFDNVQLSRNGKYCISDDGETLTVNDLGKEDEGVYLCTTNENAKRRRYTSRRYTRRRKFTRPYYSVYLRVTEKKNTIPKFSYSDDQSFRRDAWKIYSQVSNAADKNDKYYLEHRIPRNSMDLLRKFRQAKGRAKWISCSADAYENTLKKAYATVAKANPFEKAVSRQCGSATIRPYNLMLSPHNLNETFAISGCADLVDKDLDCSQSHLIEYRSADGRCNNLEKTTWGASLTPLNRLIKPIYEDGISEPVGYSPGKLYHGYAKPSAREVSLGLLASEDITPDRYYTQLIMQWGQFIDHDFGLAVENPSRSSFDAVDCEKTCENLAPCFPIPVSKNDPRMKGVDCLDFVRSAAACSDHASIKPREQVNQLTSYLDGSMIYGSSEEDALELRDLEPNQGLLRVNSEVAGPTGKAMLPYDDHPELVCLGPGGMEEEAPCFLAGDIRVNEQVMLTTMHTIWVREHNRIATKLAYINPHWGGEKIYQETRKIVAAQIQHITYDHWLPYVIGKKGISLIRKYRGYNPKVSANLINSFATAAFRFGHGLVNPFVRRLEKDRWTPIPEGDVMLHETFFKPWRIFEGGVDPIINGWLATPMKKLESQQVMNEELTDHLFELSRDIAHDLGALNIQRGRDHGLAGYNEWRKFCGLCEAEQFQDLASEISTRAIRRKLRKLYKHPGNIDLFVAGMLEDPLPGAILGKTFVSIFVEQFRRTRDGDRFWYEKEGEFTEDQLQEIKGSSLARVICDNSDDLDSVQKDVFTNVDDNTYILCSNIPEIDLTLWKE